MNLSDATAHEPPLLSGDQYVLVLEQATPDDNTIIEGVRDAQQ
jgi:hypothetical protein